MSYQTFFFACVIICVYALPLIFSQNIRVDEKNNCVPNLKGVARRINEICPTCTNMSIDNYECLNCAPREKTIPILVVCDSIWNGLIKCEDTSLCQEYQCCENFVQSRPKELACCSEMCPYCDVLEIEFPCCFNQWCTGLYGGYGRNV
jgi:hypothetical protein